MELDPIKYAIKEKIIAACKNIKNNPFAKDVFEITAKDISKKENKIKIILESDNNFMKIIIEDNGVGMDKDTLNSVSEMFFTTKKRGSGLGVSLSKEIIEQHGGNIVYNSVKGEGTRVIVTLPKEINMA